MEGILPMHGGPRRMRLLLTLAFCFVFLGCAARAARSSAPPRLREAAAPNLRSAPEEAPAGPEIPLVPVPPPPLYPGTGQKKANPTSPAKEITPTAGNTAPQPEVPPPAPAGSVVPVEKVLEQAQARYASIDSYVARFTRREAINGKLEPEELILFKFRKAPFSVYFKWLGQIGEGREVVFVQGQHGSKIHSLLAAGDVPLMPAGMRMSLAPDNALVRSASRHSITDAGFGSSLASIVNVQQALARGDSSKGTLTDRGVQKRPDYEAPLRLLEHGIPPGVEKPLPRGGKRVVGFDPENQLPVLVQTFDERGQEVEYYRYDRLQPSVALDDHDFNPDGLWKKGGTRKANP